jgi:adenylate kinase family enzyme
MERIVILGCAGTGKTTFARRLSERAGAPVICLDEIWKQQQDVPKFRALIQQAHAGDKWISDGNFSVATFDIRLPRATLVIWLERSRLICAWCAIARVFKPGESHRMRKLPEVLRFILKFEKVNRPRIEALRETYGPQVPVQHLLN